MANEVRAVRIDRGLAGLAFVAGAVGAGDGDAVGAAVADRGCAEREAAVFGAAGEGAAEVAGHLRLGLGVHETVDAAEERIVNAALDLGDKMLDAALLQIPPSQFLENVIAGEAGERQHPDDIGALTLRHIEEFAQTGAAGVIAAQIVIGHDGDGERVVLVAPLLEDILLPAQGETRFLVFTRALFALPYVSDGAAAFGHGKSMPLHA